jgi:hypothetical protein
MGYEITFVDTHVEHATGADGYAPEGPLTTFFRVAPGRPARLDPWAERLLSIRTDRILTIRANEAVDDASLVRGLRSVG